MSPSPPLPSWAASPKTNCPPSSRKSKAWPSSATWAPSPKTPVKCSNSAWAGVTPNAAPLFVAPSSRTREQRSASPHFSAVDGPRRDWGPGRGSESMWPGGDAEVGTDGRCNRAGTLEERPSTGSPSTVRTHRRRDPFSTCTQGAPRGGQFRALQSQPLKCGHRHVGYRGEPQA